MFATAFLRATGFQSADAQPLTLPQRVKRQAHMLADGVAFGVFNRAGLFGDVAIQKFSKRTLADKANPGRILFSRIRQADLVGNTAHLGFVQLAHWKQGLG